MCRCGTRTWCDGGCSCGCDHGTFAGVRRQGRAFASRYDAALNLLDRSIVQARADEREQAAQRVGLEFARRMEFTETAHADYEAIIAAARGEGGQ